MLSLRSKTQNKPQLGALNLGVTSRMKPVIKIESTDQDEWLKSILDVITKNWGKLGTRMNLRISYRLYSALLMLD